MARDRCTGLTMLELLVCLALLGILLSQALRSLGQLKQRQRLELVAQTLRTDLQQVAAKPCCTAKRCSSASASIHSAAVTSSTWALLRNAVAAMPARRNAPPRAAPIKLQWLPLSQQVRQRSNVGNMSVQARQGLVSSIGSIDVSNPNGQAIRAIVSITGRVRNCAPIGEFKQMPKC